MKIMMGIFINIDYIVSKSYHNKYDNAASSATE